MANQTTTEEVVRFMTLPEVKDLIEREQDERQELTYEQKLALDHATHFVRLPSDKSEELVKKLLELGGRVTDYYAFRISDLLPSHEDDVRAVFARERSAPDAEEIEKILAVVRDYL